MSRSCRLLTSLAREEIQKFLGSFDTVLTDCDGVIWMDDKVLYSANDTLNKLQEQGKKVFYVTNNSTKSREEFLIKCDKLGFKAEKETMIGTSFLAASYLKKLGFNKKVYVVGTDGITKELDAVGIRHTGVGPDNMVENLPNHLKNNFVLDPEVGAVIVGFDQFISYPKMMKAASYLKNKDCIFIATNTDEQFPHEGGDIVIPGNNYLIGQRAKGIIPWLFKCKLFPLRADRPGTGSIVAAVQTCAARKPIVMGKPNPTVKDVISSYHNLDPARTLMIGDRCNTDILLGTRCGFSTLLVLTGVSQLHEVKEWEKSDDPELNNLVPDFYLEKLGDLLQYL